MSLVREFKPADPGLVVEIFRSNIPKYFVSAEEAGLRDFLGKHADGYYVVESNGEVVGAGGIALNSDGTACLCWGMVRNDLTGTGLGKELTEFRIAKAKGMFGDLPIVISTSQHTEGFYTKPGFVTTERIADGFGPGIDECRMRKAA